jgi:hypothetical protein
MQIAETTSQSVGSPEGVEIAYRDAMQEVDHRQVIGKINAAIPVLRERLRQIDPEPECELEKRHLALELQGLQVRRQLAARCCPGCWLRSETDVAVH